MVITILYIFYTESSYLVICMWINYPDHITSLHANIIYFQPGRQDYNFAAQLLGRGRKSVHACVCFLDSCNNMEHWSNQKLLHIARVKLHDSRVHNNINWPSCIILMYSSSCSICNPYIPKSFNFIRLKSFDHTLTKYNTTISILDIPPIHGVYSIYIPHCDSKLLSVLCELFRTMCKVCAKLY